MIFWFECQNQAGHVWSVAPQNRRRENGVRYVSRSGSLLHLEASHVKIFQSGLKTDGLVTTSGARSIIAKVTSRGS
jgi:hypothetical protein